VLEESFSSILRHDGLSAEDAATGVSCAMKRKELGGAEQAGTSIGMACRRAGSGRLYALENSSSGGIVVEGNCLCRFIGGYFGE